ncbi:hypothetical protein GZ22_15780 [Terribacillus saccharophilus]|uniref:Uncharacterized protein n=1 Tax=Terribacillus saccharophilus TaxID=361277 RepID=A0A075LPN9_9BACI|nr:DUF6270 domain-containing protein [Terribacillus goriensis]AIF67947.1 hypothetical protein GZ22_15780 [Terribacillus goriensis]
MLNIEIKGSCVTRESFNYQDKKTYKVNKYIFQKPVKVISTAPAALDDEAAIIREIKLQLTNNESVSDFVLKQVDDSFTKQFIIGGADYFIFDLIDERMPTLRIGESYVERRPEIQKVLESFGVDFLNEPGNAEDLYGYIDTFIEGLQKYYPLERVILHKAFAQFKVSDGEQLVPLSYTFPDEGHRKYSARRAVETNLFLSSLYEYIESKYPEIHIIELKHMDYYSTHDHVYGRGYYHYNEAYYKDFLSELDSIVNGNPVDNEKQVKIANDNLHLFKLQQNILDITSGFDTDRRLLLTEIPDHKPVDALFHDKSGMRICKIYYPNGSKRGYMFYIRNKIIAKVIIKEGHHYIYTPDEAGKFAAAIAWSAQGYRLLREGSQYIEKANEVSIVINKLQRVKILFRKDDFSILLYNYNALIARHEFQQGFLHTARVFSANGKLQEVLYAKGYKRAGRMSSSYKYDEDGNLENKTDFYLDGSLYTKLEYNTDGTYFRKIFYKEDKPHRAVQFQNNKQVKRFVYYPDGSSLQQEVDFFENGTRKKVTIFNLDGHIKRVLSRENPNENLSIMEVELQQV